MVKPRTFFLNERHELPREERPTGGRAPKLAPIDWEERGKRIARSLHTVQKQYRQSPDPSAEPRYFLVALPEPALKKLSTAKGKAGEYVLIPDLFFWIMHRLCVCRRGAENGREKDHHRRPQQPRWFPCRPACRLARTLSGAGRA